jgi:hypothetical protein
VATEGEGRKRMMERSFTRASVMRGHGDGQEKELMMIGGWKQVKKEREGVMKRVHRIMARWPRLSPSFLPKTNQLGGQIVATIWAGQGLACVLEWSRCS